MTLRALLCPTVLALAASVLSSTSTAAAPLGVTGIARMERARVTRAGAVQAALAGPSAETRRRAAVALGRLKDTSSVAVLARAARDRDARVRAEVAFALGQIASARGEAALASLTRDPDAPVRVEAAEALGKIGRSVSIEPLLALLADPDVRVRGAAALGLARRADTLGVAPLVRASTDTSADVRWRATYALEKVVLPSVVLPAARARLLDADPLVRAYAARTIGRQGDHSAAADVESMVWDRDPRVVLNAVGALARLQDSALATLVGARPFSTEPAPAAPESLLLSFLYRVPDTWRTQTLVAVAAALGQVGGRAVVPTIVPALRHPSPQVRYTAASALVAILHEGAQPHILPLLRDADPAVRNKVTEMLGDVGTGVALDRLVTTLTDAAARNTRVFAASGLEKMRGAAAPAVPALARGLASDSDALAASCASALGAIGVSAAAAASDLVRAYDRWSGPAEGDTRISVMSALAALVDSAAGTVQQDSLRAFVRTVARRALADPEPRVRDAARTSAGSALGDAEAARLARAAGRPRAARAARRAVPDPTPFETALAASATIRTQRGDIHVRLFPQDAPQTVANFASLANAGYFDGLVVHRVVPNFVIQDGDPDSTGWGGPGYAIPDEFNRHRYLTGTLGMALSGPDTGGSQWFITHSPQPHLDGRYTVFGEVVDGMDVVNATEESDRIVSIRVESRSSVTRSSSAHRKTR